jgi:aminopeptidase
VYNKANIRRATARHHVDVFAITESVSLGDEIVYSDGAWLVQ